MHFFTLGKIISNFNTVFLTNNLFHRTHFLKISRAQVSKPPRDLKNSPTRPKD